MSATRHGVAVNRPFVTCMVTGEDTISGEMAGERSMGKTERIRSCVLEIPREDTKSDENENEFLKKRKRTAVKSC